MKNERGKIQLITFIGVILILTVVLFVLVVYMKITDKKKENIDINNVVSGKSNIIENETNELNEVGKEYQSVEQLKNQEEFSINFLKMENNKNNIIYSPLSIKYALKMLQEGANNNTYKQINNVIGNLSLPTYKSIDKKLSLANGIYIRDTYSQMVRNEFINTLKSKYDAEVKYDKFDSASNVNKWIEDKTFGIIKDMLQDNQVGQAKMLLINALAIDMQWKSDFDFNDTFGGTFTKEDGKEVIATMMNQKTNSDSVSYYKDKDVTALTMELEDEEETNLEFMAIMPNSNLKEYIDTLKIENIQNIDGKLISASKNKVGVQISIPKFSFDYDLNLKKDLIELGITDAFNQDEADFSKMVELEKTNGNIFVNDALHKADIDFSEKGIKAAAVTVFSVYANALMEDQKPEEINIDKPFLFLIRDKKTKEIWFTGAVYEPNLWEKDKQNYEKGY